MVTMKWKVMRSVMQAWRVCLVSWRSAVTPTASSNQEQPAGIYVRAYTSVLGGISSNLDRSPPPPSTTRMIPQYIA